MMKKIVLFFMLFFLFTQYNYGQENKIKISPSNLLGTSSILLTVEDRGSYSLTIKNKTGEKIFIKKFGLGIIVLKIKRATSQQIRSMISRVLLYQLLNP